MKNFNKMDDKECLAKFVELLETRISITTGFVSPNDNDGVLTHQYIQVRCGDDTVISQPEKMEVPLMVAPAQHVGEKVN